MPPEPTLACETAELHHRARYLIDAQVIPKEPILGRGNAQARDLDVIDRDIRVHRARGVLDDTPLKGMHPHARFARVCDGPRAASRRLVSWRILNRLAGGTPRGIPR